MPTEAPTLVAGSDEAKRSPAPNTLAAGAASHSPPRLGGLPMLLYAVLIVAGLVAAITPSRAEGLIVDRTSAAADTARSPSPVAHTAKPR
ncbi:MAG: hypothetical protein AAF411_28615 [Myxococcota bacterium]